MDPQATMIPLVGLDIGKNVHVVRSYRSDTLEALAAPITLPNTQAGFERLVGHLNELLASYPTVHLGHEPTGIYYESLGRQLEQYYAPAVTTGHLIYHFVNPHLVKLSRQALQNGRRRKSDPIDTQAIARCLQLGQVLPAHFRDEAALRLEQWADQYRRTELEQRQVSNRLLVQLDRLWPGAFVNVRRFQAAHHDLETPIPLVQTHPLERKLVQALLTHCPNPYDVLALSEAEFLAFLRTAIGRAGLKTVRKVLRNARQALLPPPTVAQILSQGVTTEWQHYQQLAQQHEQLMAEAEGLVPGSVGAVLLSVPGLSPQLIARYLAGLTDVHRFLSADHVWAFAGFDPVFEQSGDGHWVGHISKHGDPVFRDTLFLIGQSTARHCPPIAETFRRAYRGQKKRRVLATLHAAHKANRLLYHLLIHQEPYVPTDHH